MLQTEPFPRAAQHPKDMMNSNSLPAALQACLAQPPDPSSTSDVLLEAMGLSEEDEASLTEAQRRYLVRATAAILEALSVGGKVRGLRLLGGKHDFKPGPNREVGEHWSFSPNRSLGDAPDADDGLTLIEATIPAEAVNWYDTLHTLSLTAGGEWYEREIYVNPGAEVEVVRTWVGDRTEIEGVEQDLGEWFDTEEFLKKWVKTNPYQPGSTGKTTTQINIPALLRTRAAQLEKAYPCGVAFQHGSRLVEVAFCARSARYHIWDLNGNWLASFTDKSLPGKVNFEDVQTAQNVSLGFEELSPEANRAPVEEVLAA